MDPCRQSCAPLSGFDRGDIAGPLARNSERFERGNPLGIVRPIEAIFEIGKARGSSKLFGFLTT